MPADLFVITRREQREWQGQWGEGLAIWEHVCSYVFDMLGSRNVLTRDDTLSNAGATFTCCNIRFTVAAFAPMSAYCDKESEM